jgi:hypothetical protein
MTLLELSLLVRDSDFRRRMCRVLTDDAEEEFRALWEYYDGLRPEAQRTYSASTRRRLSRFGMQPLVRNIVGQSRSSVDFRAAMDTGAIVLVQLDNKKPEATSLIGSLIVGLIYAAASARPAGQVRQFNLYADEFPYFATDDFAAIIAETRKFGIATTLCHQGRSQLKKHSEDARDCTKRMASYALFKIESTDAAELAVNFDTRPKPTGELVSDPYRYLEHRPHPDPQVMAAFSELRLLLSRYRGELDDSFHVRQYNARAYAKHGFPYSTGTRPATRILQIQEHIRQYLVAAMHGNEDESLLDEMYEHLFREWQDRFTNATVGLGALLRAAPLRIEGGRTGNRKEEIRNELTQLDKFVALCKVLTPAGTTEEHTVQTPLWQPMATDPDTRATVAAIREHSRMTWCRARAEVEDEIRRRHGGSLQPEEPGKESPLPSDDAPPRPLADDDDDEPQARRRVPL